MGAVLQIFSAIEDMGECCECGVRFGAPPGFVKMRREDKRTFYCPNGHPQAYVTSTSTRLEAELKTERERRERAELARDSARKEAELAQRTKAQTAGKLKALKQRVKNGVCPCCHRSFVQLARHMATKHPGYAADKPVDEQHETA